MNVERSVSQLYARITQTKHRQRFTERQIRYGSLNLICPKYKRESEGGRSFQVQGATSFQVSATRFGIYFPMKFRVALV